MTGVLLVIPLAAMLFAERRRADRRLGWILLVPAALGCYLGYLAARASGSSPRSLQEAGAQYHGA